MYWLGSVLAGLCAGTLFSMSTVSADEPLDRKQAIAECFRGVTIYCLALGMQEEKAGEREEALEHYRKACTSYRTSGHLRACTPLLALAREMEVLDNAVAPLETQCQRGDDVVCFYLGKEYLKITEYERAETHLGRLCRKGYQPRDSKDYGPCFHLAMGFQQIGEWYRAGELLQIDCEREPDKARYSCEALRNIEVYKNNDTAKPPVRIRGFEWAEVLLGLLVLIPFAGTFLWWRGGPRDLQWLRLQAPGLEGVCWLAWELFPKKYIYPASVNFVIGFSILLAGGLALVANEKLQKKNLLSSAGRKLE